MKHLTDMEAFFLNCQILQDLFSDPYKQRETLELETALEKNQRLPGSRSPSEVNKLNRSKAFVECFLW